MCILVIDGMGGGLGGQIIGQLRKQLTATEIIAIGTNSIATSCMLKAGADKGASGENALRVCLQEAECIIGPLGIVLGDAMLGEITQNIAYLIASSKTPKILIPVNHKNIEIAGLGNEQIMADLIKDAVNRVKHTLNRIDKNRGVKDADSNVLRLCIGNIEN